MPSQLTRVLGKAQFEDGIGDDVLAGGAAGERGSAGSPSLASVSCPLLVGDGTVALGDAGIVISSVSSLACVAVSDSGGGGCGDSRVGCADRGGEGSMGAPS